MDRDYQDSQKNDLSSSSSINNLLLGIDEYTCLWSFVCMKRTNIVLDEKLIDRGMDLTGLKTQRELVDYALRELVRRKEQKSLLKLKGKFKWEGDLEEMRTSKYTS